MQHGLCGALHQSTGDHFATQIKGDWGNLDYQDLMAGVDYAIANGFVDGDRMGVCGLSGGGNLSCWIVGQTDRFKAAVPESRHQLAELLWRQRHWTLVCSGTTGRTSARNS